MYKIFFYAPTTHVEAIKSAMFAAGAGCLGHYANCAWQVLGEGQFMPLAGSHAFIGTEEQLEKVAEYRVEMLCSETSLPATLAALKKTHPYEEPAYGVVRLEEF